MNKITLDQTVPVSELQRDYNEVIERAEKSKDSIVIVRHRKPIVRLISEKVYSQLVKFRRLYEEEVALRLFEKGEAEYSARLTVSTKDMSFAKMIGYDNKTD
jgi:prevent-host-death family protein